MEYGALIRTAGRHAESAESFGVLIVRSSLRSLVSDVVPASSHLRTSALVRIEKLLKCVLLAAVNFAEPYSSMTRRAIFFKQLL